MNAAGARPPELGLAEIAVPLHRLGRRLLVATVAVLALVAVLFLVHAAAVIRFPYDLDHGEAFVLDHARLLARGEPPYRPIAREPYIVANYPPLYPLLVAAGVALRGPAFWYGRLLSTLATLGTCVCAAVVIRRRARGWLAPVAGALLLLLPSQVYEWAAYHRVDSLALFLSTLGLCLADRERHALWSVPAFVAALLARQTMFVAPLAVTVAWWMAGAHRRALLVGGLTAGVTAVISTALNVWTRGEYVRHTVAYNVNEFSGGHLYTQLKAFVGTVPILIGLGVVFVVAALLMRRRGVLVVYVALALLSVGLSGKVGSAGNYFLECILASCLATGVLLDRCVVRTPPAGGAVLAVLLPVLLLVQASTGHGIPGRAEYAVTPSTADAAGLASLLEMIRDTPGECLAEDGGYCLLAGKPIVIQPFVFRQLAREGRWDPAPFVSGIAAGRYSLVLLRFDARMLAETPLWSREMVDAVRARYHPVRVWLGPRGSREAPWFAYWLYVPN